MQRRTITGAVLGTVLLAAAFASGTFAGGGPRRPAGVSESIATSGAALDSTIVTKFIPAHAFDVSQGTGNADDFVIMPDNSCVQPDPTSGGLYTILWAGLELPQGAHITRLRLYAIDNSVVMDAGLSLYRGVFHTSASTAPTKTEDFVASVTTAGSSGAEVVESAALDEVVGSFSPAASQADHRFHTLQVTLFNTEDTRLCGVEVDYKVSAAAGDAGVVFHPVAPFRAYDSRNSEYFGFGALAPNTSRVVSIVDAHDLTTGAVTATGVVPAGATAITYNITVVGATASNFVAVTAGDADSYGAASINLGLTGAVANAATVTIAPNLTIKVWGGSGPGSAQFIVDVTGYYAPALPLPNMAG